MSADGKAVVVGVSAGALYREARALWAGLPPPRPAPHLVFEFATAPQMSNGEDRAWDLLRRADALFDAIGDASGRGDVSMLRGELALRLARIDGARASFLAAAVLYRGAKSVAGKAEAWLQLAGVDIRRGRNLSAAAQLGSAATLFRSAGDERGLQRVEIARGDLERLQGRLDLARAAYSAAADWPIETQVTHADARLKLGQVAAFLGDTAAARQTLLLALEWYRASGSPGGEGAALQELAALHARDGNYAAAQKLLVAAVGAFARAGEPAAVRAATLALAASTTALGRGAEALGLLPDAAARPDASPPRLDAVLAYFARGDALRRLRDRADAVAAYARAAAVMAQVPSALVEAGRLLGLPPVDSVGIDRPVYANGDDIDRADAEEVAELDRVDAENLERFPRHNPEARELLARTQARLAEAEAYARRN
jgi:tetratricopeptide (TPR) repeat protein